MMSWKEEGSETKQIYAQVPQTRNVKIETLIEMFNLKNTIDEMKFKITKKTN